MSDSPAAIHALSVDFSVFGSLRPWEVDSLADRLVDQKLAKIFIKRLHNYLIEKINCPPTNCDIDYIVRVASEAYDILGKHRGVIADFDDNSVIWQLFRKAIAGTNIVELEEFAADHAKKAAKSSSSIKLSTGVVKSHVAKQQVSSTAFPTLIERIQAARTITNRQGRYSKNLYNKSDLLERHLKNTIYRSNLLSLEHNSHYRSIIRYIRLHKIGPDEYKKYFDLLSDNSMTLKKLAKEISKKRVKTYRAVDRPKNKISKYRAGKQAGSG